MTAANTTTTYGSVTKTFHWLTALLMVTVIPLGVVAHDMGTETGEQIARKALLFSAHKTLGLTLFAVAVARILWAVSQPKPAPLHPERRVETWLAETVHWLLYASLVIVPLTGWIHHAATTGFAPIWWPFGQGLPFVPKDAGVAMLFSALHMTFEKILLVALILHIAGALKHHIWDKDLTLKRMWPGRVAIPALTKTPHRWSPALVASAVYLAVLGGVLATQPVEARGDDTRLATVASEWTVTEGTLGLTIRQFGSDVSGQFEDWTAAIRFEPETGTGNVEVVIAIPSLILGSVTNQALGPDYFAPGEFPTATFAASIAPVGESYEAQGTLTLRGETVPLTLPFTLTIDGTRAEMQAVTTLDRRDFGIGTVPMPDESSLEFGVAVTIDLVAERT